MATRHNTRKCSVEGCDRSQRTKGYCPSHYAKWHRTGDPTYTPPPKPKKICSVEGCDKPYSAKGYCRQHYLKLAYEVVVKKCSAEGCENISRSKGFCFKHRNELFGPAKLCSIDGCGNPHFSKGYCSTHHSRYKKHGSPHVVTMTPVGEPLMFLKDSVATATPDECIIWPYAMCKTGYGSINIEGKRWSTHRYALILFTGKNPVDKCALHAPVICHNRACINPYHLRWGTHKENAQDRILDRASAQGSKK